MRQQLLIYFIKVPEEFHSPVVTLYPCTATLSASFAHVAPTTLQALMWMFTEEEAASDASISNYAAILKFMNTSPLNPPVKSRKLWLKIPLGIIVGLLILAVGFFTYSFIQSNQLETSVKSEAKAQLSSRMPQIATDHQAAIAKLKTSPDVEGGPIYSAKYNFCFTDHDDAGIFAENYNYKCQLSYIDVLELKSMPELREYDRVTVYLSEDKPSEKSSFYRGISLRPRGTKIWVSLFIKPSSTTATVKDIDTYESMVASSVVAYAGSEAYANRTLLEEKITNDFKPDKNYLIYTWADQYFSKDIGCSFTSVLFCNSPLPKN